MRLPTAQHLKHNWRVHEYARGYQLLDLWQYPIEADGPDDFERFLELHDVKGLTAQTSLVVKALFAIRLAAGRVFGWDKDGVAFEEVYRSGREQLSRTENATVKALTHLGWVPLDNGRWTAQLAVYVIPKGRLGRVYMSLIGPFRHLIVYPSLMRTMQRRWQARPPL